MGWGSGVWVGLSPTYHRIEMHIVYTCTVYIQNPDVCIVSLTISIVTNTTFHILLLPMCTRKGLVHLHYTNCI